MAHLVQSAWGLLDLTWWQAILAAAAVLLGATISGLTGFGFALVIVPILLLIFEPPTVVVLTSSLAVASGVPIIVHDRSLIRVGMVLPLMIPALIGLVVGVQILTRADTRYIKLGAGMAVVLFALLVARGYVIPGMRSRVAPLVAGILSGILGTSTGMSGPPIVLFLTERTPEPRVFRASITFYFCTMNLIGVGLVARTGEVGWREFGLATALFPISLLGRRFGQYVLFQIDHSQFRTVTLALLILTGSSGVVTALLGLI